MVAGKCRGRAYLRAMRQMIFALAALVTSSLPALADPIPLSRISAYFNQIQTAQAQFQQYNPDGSVSSGTLSIKRPGRMRFEYAPPTEALVLAAGGQLAIFDGKSNNGPGQYQLSKTPLNIILERNVDLSRARMVKGQKYDGTATYVLAQDPQHPEYGTLELVFLDNPIRLRQWEVTDETGAKTRVILDGFRTNVNLGASMFSIPHEAAKRQR